MNRNLSDFSLLLKVYVVHTRAFHLDEINDIDVILIVSKKKFKYDSLNVTGG